MLTKDLLKFSRRDQRVHPKYLKPNDKTLIQTADELSRLYKAYVGQSWRDLIEQIKNHPDSSDGVFQGFGKLLEDRCTFGESDEALEAQRWKWLELSRSLRLQSMQSRQDFEARMTALSGLGFEEIQNSIYSDLPEFRSIQSFDEISGEALVHRYNTAQIQGLLLRAQKVRFIIDEKDVVTRRRLLQKLRFCRLLAEFVENPEGALLLDISGPLAMFEQTQSYGMRLCQFFPYVLLMPKWQLEATVKLGENVYDMKIDSSRPIRSHYRSFTGYIPEEFQAFIKAFNALPTNDRQAWSVEEGQEHLNLGHQSYSFPDLTLRHESGALRHLELFHKWHEAELRKRLEVLAGVKNVPLVLGVSLELAKSPSMEGLLAYSKEIGISIFTFRLFPTVKAILTYLPKVKS
jgi:predicted nuclease of restriction endonuclease-like RecB superfamily